MEIIIMCVYPDLTPPCAPAHRYSPQKVSLTQQQLFCSRKNGRPIHFSIPNSKSQQTNTWRKKQGAWYHAVIFLTHSSRVQEFTATQYPEPEVAAIPLYKKIQCELIWLLFEWFIPGECSSSISIQDYTVTKSIQHCCQIKEKGFLSSTVQAVSELVHRRIKDTEAGQEWTCHSFTGIPSQGECNGSNLPWFKRSSLMHHLH